MTETTFDQLFAQIANVELSLEFLLAGFDNNGEGHLFHIDGNRAPASFDAVGFCAIGSGGLAAQSALAFHMNQGNFSTYFEWPGCVYCVCDAKFRAESASDVGMRTFLTVYQHDQDTRFISPVRIDNELRRDWERHGAHRLPKSVVKAIPDKVFTAKELSTPDGMRRFLGKKSTTHRQTMQEYEAMQRSLAHDDKEEEKA